VYSVRSGVPGDDGSGDPKMAAGGGQSAECMREEDPGRGGGSQSEGEERVMEDDGE
jgi:hypothetical protein